MLLNARRTNLRQTRHSAALATGDHRKRVHYASRLDANIAGSLPRKCLSGQAEERLEQRRSMLQNSAVA